MMSQWGWPEVVHVVPMSSIKYGERFLGALLERLYVGPSAAAWRVRDVASGFRFAAVCSLLMLDGLLAELANELGSEKFNPVEQ